MVTAKIVEEASIDSYELFKIFLQSGSSILIVNDLAQMSVLCFPVGSSKRRKPASAEDAGCTDGWDGLMEIKSALYFFI